MSHSGTVPVERETQTCLLSAAGRVLSVVIAVSEFGQAVIEFQNQIAKSSRRYAGKLCEIKQQELYGREGRDKAKKIHSTDDGQTAMNT